MFWGQVIMRSPTTIVGREHWMHLTADLIIPASPSLAAASVCRSSPLSLQISVDVFYCKGVGVRDLKLEGWVWVRNKME